MLDYARLSPNMRQGLFFNTDPELDAALVKYAKRQKTELKANQMSFTSQLVRDERGQRSVISVIAHHGLVARTRLQIAFWNDDLITVEDQQFHDGLPKTVDYAKFSDIKELVGFLEDLTFNHSTHRFVNAETLIHEAQCNGEPLVDDRLDSAHEALPPTTEE